MPHTTTSVNMQNPYQDAGQSANFANAFSTTDPLQIYVAEGVSAWNRPTASGEPLAEKEKQRHLFGNHIREAVAIVKDWMKYS